MRICWKHRYTMGYTTDFLGYFHLSRALTEQEHAFLTAFSASRRMRLDVEALHREFGGQYGRPDVESSETVYGPDGAFFVRELPSHHSAILDSNTPPHGQPSLWCHWAPAPNTRSAIQWNGVEKFYNYVEWLQYLIDAFLDPWGIKVWGAVQWTGEDPTDCGVISVRASCVNVHYEEGSEEADGDGVTDEEMEEDM